MAVSASDIDELNAAIAAPERQVANGGEQVTYRSITDLIAAKRHLEVELSRTAGKRARRQVQLVYAGRGYD